jgi:hypothetical protein
MSSNFAGCSIGRSAGSAVYEICRTSIQTENVHPQRVDTDTAARPDGRRLEGAGARAKLFNVFHSDRSATNAR